MSDLPAVVDEPEKKDLQEMPAGTSPVHGRVEAYAIWRLCCRLRLDMKEEGLSLKDAHQALLLAYPDLALKTTELRKFMEDYVDTAIVVDPSFWKRALMRSKASLNTALATSEVAERMQKKWQDAEKKVGTEDGVPLKDWLAGGKKVIEAREAQAQALERVGLGPERKKRETASKPSVVAPVHVQAENVQFNLGEAAGGSFQKRMPSADAQVKQSPETSG